MEWSDPGSVLDVAARLLAAPRPEILTGLSREIAALVPHRAAAMRTPDCARIPVKTAGDAAVTERITSAELDHLTADAIRGMLGGEERALLTITSGTGALLVLAVDGPPDPAAVGVVARLWELVGIDAAARAAGSEPELLAGNLAAATARAHAVADLTRTHATALTALLAVLRSGRLDDGDARRAATDLASAALVELHATPERDRGLATEPAAAAFDRLAALLAPLVRHAAVELVGPDSVRAVPQDVAHVARAVTHAVVLAALDGTARVRAEWRIDGDTLRVTVRDDGPGTPVEVDGDAAGRLAAVGGAIAVDAVPGWGTTVTATLPLEHAEPPAAGALDRLHPRELQVLAELTRGLRNRQIADGLHLSEHTVKFHVRNILDKLGVASRGEAAALARELDLGGGRAG